MTGEGDGRDPAFDSTSVSLSTSVPRPLERRNDERVSAMLRVGKLVTGSSEQLIRIKKETARGIMTIQETRSSNPKK